MPHVRTITAAPVVIEKPLQIQVLPNPQPIDLIKVEWKVLTPSTLPLGNDWVLFALTPKAYRGLALNQAEILRFVTESKWLLDYYREGLTTQENEDKENEPEPQR